VVVLSALVPASVLYIRWRFHQCLASSIRRELCERSRVARRRSQFFKDLTTPFYGADRANAKVSQGTRDSFWMQAGIKNVYDCIKAFSETDQTEDLKKFDVPTLIIHGDDDQIVPIGASSAIASELIDGATLKIYPGSPHGLTTTHKEQLNADLLEFLENPTASLSG